MVSPNISPELQSHPKYNEIVEWFEQNGWKEGKPLPHEGHHREWYNRYPDEPRCKTNEPKALLIVARLYSYLEVGVDRVGLDLALCAEPSGDGSWVSFTAYGFGEVVEIPNQVERLLTAWRAIAKF